MVVKQLFCIEGCQLFCSLSIASRYSRWWPPAEWSCWQNCWYHLLAIQSPCEEISISYKLCISVNTIFGLSPIGAKSQESFSLMIDEGLVSKCQGQSKIQWCLYKIGFKDIWTHGQRSIIREACFKMWRGKVMVSFRLLSICLNRISFFFNRTAIPSPCDQMQ